VGPDPEPDPIFWSIAFNNGKLKERSQNDIKFDKSFKNWMWGGVSESGLIDSESGLIDSGSGFRF
jgi:hypothetical protein